MKFKTGEKIKVKEVNSRDWAYGENERGLRGWFPYRLVTMRTDNTPRSSKVFDAK